MRIEFIETALAKTGIPAAFEAAKQFLEKIAGPAAEEVGLLLQDRVRIYRFRNELNMLAKAQKMLYDAIQIGVAWYLPIRKHRKPPALKAELEAAGFDVSYQDGGHMICGL